MSLHKACPRHVHLVQQRRRVQWCGSMGGVHLPRDMESVFVVLLCRCFCLRDCWWLSVVAVLLSVGVWAPLCLSCLFGCCRLPSLPIVASLPPAVGPVWRPGPVCALVPPSGYLVAFVTAWLPCFIAGSVVVLCRPYFMLSHGSKGLWPCVGLFSLYTMMHVLLGCSVLPR